MPRVRPKTLSIKQLRLLPVVRDEWEDLPIQTDHERPKTRSDCVDGPRPCPIISCRHHLYLDVDPVRGSLKFNFPEVGPDELDRLPHTCSLDIADEGDNTLEEVSKFMNFTSRERTRQIVDQLRAKLEERLRELGVDSQITWDKSNGD